MWCVFINSYDFSVSFISIIYSHTVPLHNLSITVFCTQLSCPLHKKRRIQCTCLGDFSCLFVSGKRWSVSTLVLTAPTDRKLTSLIETLFDLTCVLQSNQEFLGIITSCQKEIFLNISTTSGFFSVHPLSSNISCKMSQFQKKDILSAVCIL